MNAGFPGSSTSNVGTVILDTSETAKGGRLAPGRGSGGRQWREDRVRGDSGHASRG